MKNNKFNILLIDKNTSFALKLSERIQEYSFNVINIFDKMSVTLYDDVDLILLSINDENNSSEIIDFIKLNLHAKIIILSDKDIGEQREIYFSHGILDFHLTTQKIEHITDDIIDIVYDLKKNKKETILILDNSKELCLELQSILNQRNYKVLFATKGKECIEILKKNEISLLILDMEIDDINALDLLEGLREMYLLDQFFVLTISNSKNSSLVRDALKNGAEDFLKKPFLYEELLLKVDILIKSSRNRKNIQEHQQEAENNLKRIKELLDSTIGAMFIFEDNLCINCNFEAVKLLGFKLKNEILNKKIFTLFSNINEQNKEYLLNDTLDYSFEDVIVNHVGKSYDVQVKERNILIANKTLKIIALMDITDMKRQEKIISQQAKLASMGEMIGNIAHQWRQPLNSISIAAGGIKLNYELNMEDKEETIFELDNIVENTKFLSSTVESFQNFLKINKKTNKFYIQSTLKKTLALIHSNLKISNIIVIEDYTCDIEMSGVENELIQVFLNIINNSIDILQNISVQDKSKYIKITIEKKDTFLNINIHDNGSGIPKDIIDKVFEPYFTTKHQSQGTGLGLYMSHQIIKKLNGEIEVHNKKITYNDITDYGACFSISFPLYVGKE